MNAISKLAIAGLVGVAGPLISGEALAGPIGAAASAVASFQTAPIEKTSYAGYSRRHHGFAPYARYNRGWRPYPYHTYASPYRRGAYGSAYRYPAFASSWRHYPRHHGWGYRTRYSVAPAYSAAPAAYPAVNPYFTSYSSAGTVSYPVYRVDHYKVDYSNPIVNYGSQYCDW